MPNVSVHYWAGAKAAAGVEFEVYAAVTVADALAQALDQHSDAHFARVLAMSSILVDGRTLHESDRDQPLAADVAIEILPPFAGGC